MRPIKCFVELCRVGRLLNLFPDETLIEVDHGMLLLAGLLHKQRMH